MAGTAGLEPVTSGVTGRRSNQLSYVPANCQNFKYNIISSRGSSKSRVLATTSRFHQLQTGVIASPSSFTSFGTSRAAKLSSLAR